ERPYGEAPPPHVGLGERTDGGAGEAASPVRIHVRPDLVAREPVDLVLLTPLKTTLSPKGTLLVGQLMAHLRQTLQKSSTPMSTGWSATSGRSVMIGSGMWIRAPNFRWMRSPLRPSSPTPDASPAA